MSIKILKSGEISVRRLKAENSMKEDAICELDPETLPYSLTKAPLKCTEVKWKTALWSDLLKI